MKKFVFEFVKQRIQWEAPELHREIQLYSSVFFSEVLCVFLSVRKCLQFPIDSISDSKIYRIFNGSKYFQIRINAYRENPCLIDFHNPYAFSSCFEWSGFNKVIRVVGLWDTGFYSALSRDKVYRPMIMAIDPYTCPG